MEPYFVVIVDPSPREPTYHRVGEGIYKALDDEIHMVGVKTRCGIIGPCLSAYIRHDHAAQIGRPCKRCFP